MDDIQKRLSETAAQCISSYEVWSSAKSDDEKRQAFSDAIHELRKVASRLEIEMAMSEREEQARKPIPIPTHRANRKNKKGADNGASQDAEDMPAFLSNGTDQPASGRPQGDKPQQRRGRGRPAKKDAAEG